VVTSTWRLIKSGYRRKNTAEADLVSENNARGGRRAPEEFRNSWRDLAFCAKITGGNPVGARTGKPVGKNPGGKGFPEELLLLVNVVRGAKERK